MTTPDGDVMVTLPDLQAQVEALHARLLPGGGAGATELVETLLTGRVDAVPPEGLAVLERTFGDQYGAAFGRLWSGDYGDHTDDDGEPDESGADWALARELIYQTRGNAELTEILMRASGLYRDKYDDIRRITRDKQTNTTTHWRGGRSAGSASPTW